MSNMNAMTPPSETPPNTDDLGQRAKDLARDASSVAAERLNASGSRGMSSVAGAVRAAAARVDESGRKVAADADGAVRPEHVEALTAPLTRTAEYLDSSDPRRVVADIDGAVKAHPYRAIAAGLVTGWLVGRFMSRR